ncbi:MAG: hypothetical protein IPM46_05650 [Flavobacteriales bacterium]|nr:hypothetical protein [Flavobacteriales bacterium]
MVEWEYALKAGKTDGSARQFHANGAPQYTGDFKDDQRTGTHVEYHANGQKAEEYSYVAGKGEGGWKNWHPNGKVSKEGTLKAGSPIGEVRTYDEWGTLRKIERYGEGGKLQGLREEFNKNGSRHMDMEYKNDLLVRYVYYGLDGKVLGQGTRSKGKFQLKGYHPDGTVRVEGLYLDEGAKDGLWKYYHPDGTLDSEENYAKGTETGIHKYFDEGGFLTRQDEYYEREGNTYRAYTRYFRSGQVSERGQMKGSNVEGVLRRFYANGTQRTIEYYVDGSREGWQEYFDPDGKRVYAERYDAGAIAERVDYDEQGVEYGRAVVPAGPFELVTKYPNGKVMQRLGMMNGWLHGKSIWLYPDGGTELEGSYLNGDRHGTWIHYHPNGKKRSETAYVMGEEEGEVKQYHMDGTIRFETTYRSGLREGASREYHANGKIAFLRVYENGEQHGPTVSYTYDGVPQMVRFYHKDDLVAYGSPAADGSVKDTIRLNLGLARLETRFPDGAVSRTMSYRNGAIDGEFIEYHANGQLMEKTMNKAGQVEGTSMEYYPNGKTMESLPYVDGQLHGERIIYWDNGQVRERVTYVHGQMHGPWTVHDRTGKRLATYRMRNDDVVEIGK